MPFLLLQAQKAYNFHDSKLDYAFRSTFADHTSYPTPDMSSESSESTLKPTSTRENPFVNDPAQSGYDPDASNWANLFSALTGRMSDNGAVRYREALYTKNEERDIAKCNEWRDWCFQYSPTIIFMKKNIEALNGDLNATNVRCKRCITRQDANGNWVRQGGGFSPDHGILICANEMRNKKHLEDTLAHEMVHAWDHLRWKVDWADLRHAACSEVCSVIIQLEEWCANME
jgi:inner membrane protease ATP23